MKKLLTSFLIIFLILFTVIIKNSTKRIDDEIFVKKTARLAAIRLANDEILSLKSALTCILSFVAELEKVKTKDIA